MLAAIAVLSLTPRKRVREGMMNRPPPMPRTDPKAPATSAMRNETMTWPSVRTIS
jgi:hypothetical protein